MLLNTVSLFSPWNICGAGVMVEGGGPFGLTGRCMLVSKGGGEV